MIRRFLAAAAFASTVLAVAPAAAQSPPPGIVELNPPLPTDAKGKIEVVEFFWYECPHCYALEPYLEAWVKKLPSDVEFRRVPATFNDRWNISARVFYTLDAMGLLDKLHRPLLDAIHKDHLRITDERQLTEWLQGKGVDVAKFSATLKSFAVEGRLKRASALVQGSKIDGVPALMLNGQYVIGAGVGGSEERMLAIASSMIDQQRKALAAATPPASSAAPAKKK
ncbi:MAG TPA: thiol:disulfide interchange protein DsbA/DsbL [Burkholderiales bacterium]|nr:thiol:disulfide interchange protein DsbA/DsbL [Burkholderiales bacterium]